MSPEIVRRLTAEEIEQGNEEWANFGLYHSLFGDDPSLMEGLDEEDGDGRPVVDAGVASSADAPEERGARMSDGGAEESEEGSSERSTAHARKKAKLSETPDASLVSKPDPHFSQLVHMLEEMDRHAAATDACEEADWKEGLEIEEAHWRQDFELQEEIWKEQMDMCRLEMDHNNKLFEMQMQQQAQLHQMLLTMLNIASESLKSRAVGSLALHSPEPGLPAATVPTPPSAAHGSSGLSAPPFTAAHPELLPAGLPMPAMYCTASIVVPAAVPMAALTPLVCTLVFFLMASTVSAAPLQMLPSICRPPVRSLRPYRRLKYEYSVSWRRRRASFARLQNLASMTYLASKEKEDKAQHSRRSAITTKRNA